MERQDLVKLSYAYGVSTALQEAGMDKKAADQEALAFVADLVKQAEDDETGGGGMGVLEGLGRGAAGGAGLGIGLGGLAALLSKGRIRPKLQSTALTAPGKSGLMDNTLRRALIGGGLMAAPGALVGGGAGGIAGALDD